MMHECQVCHLSFSRSDNMLRHQRYAHQNADKTLPGETSSHKASFRFAHPFAMVVTGPSGSGKTHWTRQLLKSSFIQPEPERLIWCYGQWQPLYDDLKRDLSSIEFVRGIPDYLNDPKYLDTHKRNLLILDDLMTDAKCDSRVADLFTKGSHHRNLSVIYLTQNLFPQGKACRDIALNTQYLTLFNNPIDRQQVATLAKRIYPNASAMFMKRYEEAVQQPYGYLVVDLKPGTPEHRRLHKDLFPENEIIDDTLSDDDDDNEEEEETDTVVSRKRTYEDLPSPPGIRKWRRVDRPCYGEATLDIWERRFREPIRRQHQEAIKLEVDHYIDQGYSMSKALTLAANEELPQLRKKLRERYTEFLTDYHGLQRDYVQQQIMQSAQTLFFQHNMSFSESIRQAVKLRKDLLNEIWPKLVHEDAVNMIASDENKEEDDVAKT